LIGYGNKDYIGDKTGSHSSITWSLVAVYPSCHMIGQTATGRGLLIFTVLDLGLVTSTLYIGHPDWGAGTCNTRYKIQDTLRMTFITCNLRNIN